MRIISGACKGRPLKAVPGMKTRPTTDKMKETIFNMIGPYFEGGKGLDLFAGSGGLGLEAMSRGFDSFIFVDKDHQAVQTVKANLASCGYAKQAEVYRNEAGRALKALEKRNMQFDLVFLDPPYMKQELETLLREIGNRSLLAPSGKIVCEHSHDVRLPAEIGQLLRVRTGDYGGTGISIYEKKQSCGEEER